MKNKLVKISTTLDERLKNDIKKTGLKLNYFIRLGYRSYCLSPIYQEQLTELKKEIDNLKRKYNRKTDV